MKHVAVFGMGYVGCVTAACVSRDGHHVIGVDIDRDKIATLRAGSSPVAEPGLEELIRAQVAAERLEATTNLDDAVRRSELALIAVGTPSAADGSVEYHAVERVVRAIGTVLRDTGQRYDVVVRSTLLPGILEDRLAPLLEEMAGCELGPHVTLCNNPEFLRETTAIRDYDHPPFVLVGAAEPDQADDVLAMYERVQAERFVTDTRTAALVKYACNAFHALKIDFANEIGTLARAFGADGQEVMRLLCEDKHLNISPVYLRPGFAFGGSCLPKDVRALVRFAQQHAVRTELLNAILPSNEAHLQRALAAVRETGCRKVGLIGLSFKAGTDDLRESPAIGMIETLIGKGYKVRVYDPSVSLASLVGANRAYIESQLPHIANLICGSLEQVLAEAEVIVIANWEPAFSDVPRQLRSDQILVDLVRLIDRPDSSLEGRYYGIAW